jgi:hypothetical protein
MHTLVDVLTTTADVSSEVGSAATKLYMLYLLYLRLTPTEHILKPTTAVQNTELPWLKQHSTTRRIFSQAN